ncbi:hypothetical protein [Glutamicibacter nicotianae]|uniref:hypothetical protein n=1 Tax=Glutamicibacter nicotianae TaxID=37929 RepID=UPI000EF93C91|nr:hypothetical protein [Glutamicibacter nicotianae]
MATWHIYTKLTLPQPPREDAELLDLTAHLTDHGVSATIDPTDLASITISLTLEAAGHLEAAQQATDLQTAGPLAGAEITTMSLRTEKDFNTDYAAAQIPDLVTLTDIAHHAGITRQRVRELSQKDPAFPPVALTTNTVALYLKSSAEAWARNRNTTTGRPRNNR